MDSATENVVALGPTVLTAIFIGLAVIIFTFLIKWIKQEDSNKGSAKNEKPDKLKSTSSDASGKHGKKEQTGTVKQSSKKKLTERENRRSARANEKGFSHPWLLATLKGHSGRVLDMDFSANGKFLASCGDEDPDPGGLSSATTDSSSSSSESNKENSLPPSQSPSPIMHKGLSRRQRKNRKREHTHAVVVVSKSEREVEVEVEVKEQTECGSSKNQKKTTKKVSKTGAVINGGLGTKLQHHRHAPGDREYTHLELEPLEEYKKLRISEEAFANLLATKYSLKQENMAILGYPVRPAKRPHLDRNHEMMMAQGSAMYFNYILVGTRKHNLDVHAVEFVPKRESSDSGNGSEGSGSSSEEESSSGSEAPDDLSTISLPKLAPGTINRRDVHYHICVRCGSFFYATSKKYITVEQCRYHWGKLRTLNHGYGPLEYTCCSGSGDSQGCAYGKFHVWNGPLEPNVNSSFVETEPPKVKHPHDFYGVYSLDCEMSYTVLGLEVVKVSVVDISGKPVYNEFVRPKNEIVDFNTRFSGITEQDFIKNKPKTLTQVQKDIKKLINSETVLIGHGLENDLKALKIIHKTIVDTAYTFPHYKGPPYKRSLKSLTRACLKRDIQCSEKGHDSFEDARACMELMLYRLRRDFNL